MGVTFLKRLVVLLLTMSLSVAMCGTAWAVTTSASCAILMDAQSGRILYEQNIHERRSIASITKLMTALVAVERMEDLDELVVVQPEWTGIEGSSIYLRPNETVTMRELLYGLLLQSGNDAATAIAGHIAGSTDEFAVLMNDRAARLGMNDSCFTNPSGLSDEGHFSTAYDMALLACACLENEIISTICATQCAQVGQRTFYNHNKLLHRYEGCIGMKTGYTERAGRTLVSAAKRNGQTLVCVTLNDGNDWEDHERLFDYGYESFPTAKLCAEGEEMCRIKLDGSLIPFIPVVTGGEISYPLKEGETPKRKFEMATSLPAPVKAGSPVGKVSWTLNDTVIAEVPLICGQSAGKDSDEILSLWERLFTPKTRKTVAPNGAHLV